MQYWLCGGPSSPRCNAACNQGRPGHHEQDSSCWPGQKPVGMTATVADVARGAREFTASALEPAVEVVKGESLHTSWELPPTVTIPVPPGDYRDQLPPSIREVAQQYAPVVRKGRWTHGLFECWAPKTRPLKAAVHIPCWEAYHVNPLEWRGLCFGRTCHECWWVGLHYARWARAAYGGMLSDWRSRGAASAWKAAISSMACFYCATSVAAECLVGHAASFGGAYGLNFMSWWSCPARLELRRRFQLPPTLGLPDGCDDCAVHTCCMYELRELAVRGVDAPGMHVLDVAPGSFAHLPGFRERMAQREAELAAMGAEAYTEHPTAGPAATRPPPEQEMPRRSAF